LLNAIIYIKLNYTYKKHIYIIKAL